MVYKLIIVLFATFITKKIFQKIYKNKKSAILQEKANKARIQRD